MPISRGDIFRIRFGETRGHELRGPHYGLVVQADIYELSTAVVVPLSSSLRPAPWHVPLKIEGKTTYAIVEQIRVVDIETRLREYIGNIAGTDEMRMIDEEMALVLGLHPLFEQAGDV